MKESLKRLKFEEETKKGLEITTMIKRIAQISITQKDSFNIKNKKKYFFIFME